MTFCAEGALCFHYFYSNSYVYFKLKSRTAKIVLNPNCKRNRPDTKVYLRASGQLCVHSEGVLCLTLADLRLLCSYS